jgi:hypothetical protein
MNRREDALAVTLAREALSILEQTDGLNFQGDALCDLADVLHAAGRHEEAAAALSDALDRYERKRNLPMARQVRKRIADLEASSPTRVSCSGGATSGLDLETPS